MLPPAATTTRFSSGRDLHLMQQSNLELNCIGTMSRSIRSKSPVLATPIDLDRSNERLLQDLRQGRAANALQSDDNEYAGQRDEKESLVPNGFSREGKHEKKDKGLIGRSTDLNFCQEHHTLADKEKKMLAHAKVQDYSLALQSDLNGSLAKIDALNQKNSDSGVLISTPPPRQ